MKVGRQIGRRRDTPQRRLRTRPPPRLKRAPGTECPHEAGGDLRVLRIELKHGVGDEVVAGAVEAVELGVVGLDRKSVV